MKLKKFISNNLFAVILLFLLFPSISNAKTNLTFTSHPTNTKLLDAMYSAQGEVDYYHEKLANIFDVFLYEEENLLPEIDNLYSWIGYDFDRSNLTALDALYSYNSATRIMAKIYKNYIEYLLANDYYSNAILDSLASIKLCTQKIDQLLSLNRPFKDLNDKFFISLNSELNKLAIAKREFELILQDIKHTKIQQLRSLFEKFNFTLAMPQLRFTSDELSNFNEAEKSFKDIFKVISSIIKTQPNANFDIIIANFSSIKQIQNLKKLKKKYSIINTSTIPLVETAKDIDYVIANFLF